MVRNWTKTAVKSLISSVGQRKGLLGQLDMRALSKLDSGGQENQKLVCVAKRWKNPESRPRHFDQNSSPIFGQFIPIFQQIINPKNIKLK
jgi:hypothetical protein